VIQLLDGISAAVLGVMFPLVVADITRGTGRFNLGLGLVGSAMGIGASVSTVLAGYLIDDFGRSSAFLGLGAIALLGLALVWLAMPETRPEEEKGRPMLGGRQAPLAAASRTATFGRGMSATGATSER
jgi:MFS family permease